MVKKTGALSKMFTGKMTLIIGLAVFVLLGLVFVNAYYKNYQLKQEIKSMMDEAEKIENNNAELRVLLEKVKSPVYAEQIGRTNFGLVKPGENQVVLIGNSDKLSGQTNGNMIESTKLSNPRQWWNYFFNHN